MIDREKARAFLDDHVAVGEAIQRGVRASLIRHARLGQQVVICRDKKVCWVPAIDILTPEELAEATKPASRIPRAQ
jgi:hypothetical protein